MENANVTSKRNLNFKKGLQQIKHDLIDFPLYIISSPFKGYGDIKFEGEGKTWVATVILLIFGFVQIIKEVYSGYLFNSNKPEDINILMIFATSVLPILLLTIANWSITTLMDGTGSMKDIYMVFTYSLYLPIIFNIIQVVLSNVMSLDESAFVYFFAGFSIVAYCLYAFIGLVTVHEFGFLKSVMAVILTIAAILIILFITVLLISLMGEVFIFIRTIISEIILHLS
ncbi:YIP1 family protein [Fastidiosipila sanguinis]|uniref:Yip1 domain-containing protein n=1 Tax=Fastidiosipila sanguinis TaxID=236753 RepID=A0A2S0KNG2_9FIRM|nr:YIP1 family protein [Fastidiosipila sanguinis]AVM42558.1 hypothetical protein C5Q98_04695 [Fastidiosipila sanguinis]